MSENVRTNPATTNPPKQKGIISYLPVVITCAMFAFCPVTIQSSCLGLFYKDMAAAHSVPVSQVSVFITIGMFGAAALLPLVGSWLKKYDVRVISAAHVIAIAISLIVMACSPNIIGIWIAGGILVTACVPLMSLINPTLIQRWFREGARTAIGVVAAFTGIGGVVFSLLGGAAQSAWGWQTAMLVYAATVLLICLPLCVFGIRNKPEDRGLHPFTLGNETKSEKKSARKANAYWTVNPSIATKSLAFVLVVLCGAIASSSNMTYRFLPTYLSSCTDLGMAVVITSSVMISVISVTQACAKPILGFICDLFTPLKGIVLACACGVLGYALIMLAPESALFVLGSCCYAVFFTCVSVLMPILAGAVFGMGDNYSVMYGRVLAIARIIAAPAATVWPLMAENLGGWDSVFITGMIMVSAFAILSIFAVKTSAKLPRIEQDPVVEKPHAKSPSDKAIPEAVEPALA